jgi:hypothetical protein
MSAAIDNSPVNSQVSPVAERKPLPDFVVIGAMKSGSTTLYHDLLGSQNVFLPDKETGCLHHDSCRSLYGDLFRNANPNQLRGEFGTTYAMLPDAADVLVRAKDVLPAHTRIIYLVREPVSRSLSHHRHMLEWHDEEKMGNDVNEEIQTRPEIINYSRYAMQIKPWIEMFGRENVLVIPFEKYVRHRRATIDELAEFLGVALETDHIDNDTVHNRSDGKPVLNSFWLRIATSSIYRGLLRPFTNQKVRDRFRQVFFPKASQEIIPPSQATLSKMLSIYAEDIDELQSLTGTPNPPWDIEELRQKYLNQTGFQQDPANADADDKGDQQ